MDYHYSLLWQQLSDNENSWELFTTFRHLFYDFHFEGKVPLASIEMLGIISMFPAIMKSKDKARWK